MEIVLIRHGKPRSADSSKLNAAQYTQWIRDYNKSDVCDSSRPKAKIVNLASYYIVASDLKRAVHSAKIYSGQAPEATFDLLREMEIPRYKLPFKLNAFTWVYCCRVLWTIGFTGAFETYKEARKRANIAAAELIELAQTKEKVMVFGHGYMNFHIRRALIKQGWQLNSKSSKYWGKTCLIK